MNNLSYRIKKQVIQVINTIIFKEKKQVFKFSGVHLYPSEVHLMLTVKSAIDTNVTEIATQLGLTKGAISQTLIRLEKKGIIFKTRDPYKKNELTVSFTDFGKKVCEVCQAKQAAFMAVHEDYLAKLTSTEKEVILDFLLHMEKTIDDFDVP